MLHTKFQLNTLSGPGEKVDFFGLPILVKAAIFNSRPG